MEKIVQFKSSSIFYRVEGEGYPVVLIHGFAEDGRIWQHQIQYLSENFTVIIPDLPGSGKSPFNSTLETIDDLAEAVASVLHQQQIGDCIIIGHSMGGYIGLSLAERYPGMLKGLGLFHSTAYEDTEEKKLARQKGISFLRKYGASEFLNQSIPNLFSEIFKRTYPGIVSELIERYNNFNPQSLVSYYNAMMKRTDRTHVLKNWKNPVLIVAGKEDPAVPLAQSLSQSHIPEICYFHILINTAHMGMLENTNLTNELLKEFLNQATD